MSQSLLFYGFLHHWKCDGTLRDLMDKNLICSQRHKTGGFSFCQMDSLEFFRSLPTSWVHWIDSRSEPPIATDPGSIFRSERPLLSWKNVRPDLTIHNT